MKRPHERTFRYAPESLSIKDEVGANYALDVDEEDGPLFAAAPDMARALMGLLRAGKGLPEERHTAVCWEDDTSATCTASCAAAREALRKAGVL